MCSVQEEGEILPPQKRVDTSTSARKCMKCQNPACVLIRLNDPMCSECFVSYTTHKFRSAFGKSKVVRDNEKVLVAFSGGQCSCAMVHLIQGGLSKRAQKKLRFTPTLVYIDEGGVLNCSREERHLTIQNIVEIIKATEIPYRIYHLEQALSLGFELDSVLSSSSSPCDQLASSTSNDDRDLENSMKKLKLTEMSTKSLQELITQAKTLTAKQNIVEMLRLRLLVAVAKQEGVSKVLLGDAATRLSIRLLSNISQGQGAHLPYELTFADKRYKDIIFLRPMREFTAKEVSIYNRLNNVHTNFLPNLSTKASSHASIECLTEKFVTGLQADYPNTVSTIFRTGEKFDLNQMEVADEQTCAMCHCPLDTDVGPSSALSATKFSQSLCNTMATRHNSHGDVPTATVTSSCVEDSCHGNKETTCCGEGDGSCQKPKGLTWSDMDTTLCYGCQLIARDMTSVAELPSYVTQEVSRRSRRQQMKEEIGDFLIQDG